MEVPQEKYNLLITDSYSKKKNGILRNIAEYPSAHKCTSSKLLKNRILKFHFLCSLLIFKIVTENLSNELFTFEYIQKQLIDFIVITVTMNEHRQTRFGELL